MALWKQVITHVPNRATSALRSGLCRCLNTGLPASGLPEAAVSPAEGGLFGIPNLNNPESWRRLADEAIERCDELVQRVQLAQVPSEVVQGLDDVSDTVCQVYDAAELCRNVHADPEWRHQAHEACVYLGGYIGQLNTHTGLYRALVRALDGPHAASQAASTAAAAAVTAGSGPGDAPRPAASASAATATARDWLEPEARLVGGMLRREFENSGVHLPEGQRQRLMELTLGSQAVGMQIGANLADAKALGRIQLDRREAAATSVQQLFPMAAGGGAMGPAGGGGGGGGMQWRRGPAGGTKQQLLPADGATCHALLRWSEDEGLRRKAYMAMHSSPAANLDLICSLVEQRRDMARLLGAPSYSHYLAQGSTLADTPAAATAFLHQLAEGVGPRARAEVEAMQRFRQQTGVAGLAAVQPWDRQYLMGNMKAHVPLLSSHAVAEYFPLHACVAGLGELLRRTMGVTLQEVPFGLGEAWAPAGAVTKLAALHEDEGLVGHIYLDLHPRPGKFPSAAHFTLRCGRALPCGGYQRPLVALVCNFQPSGGAGAPGPVLLSHGEVTTLFHEFGHALSSLMSRTHFQHAAGTRGPLDIVEIPSHWMERFASDPDSLRLWARHHSSGEPIPTKLVTALKQADSMFAGLDTQHQVVLSLVDQLLHGQHCPDPSTLHEEVASMVASYSSLPPPPAGCHAHIRFGHLVGYGGCYYSYLYAASLADALWQEHFEGDPLTREAGDHVRRLLLQPGGAKPPQRLVENLLGPGAMQRLEGGWAPQPHHILSTLGGGRV